METTLFYIAIGVSVIHFLLIVSTFLGMDGFDGVDADFDGDLETEDGHGGVLQMFTFKNMVAFLLGLSWGALACIKEYHLSYGISIIIGSVLGIIIVAIQSALFLVMKKLEDKRIPSLDGIEGLNGKVYLTIPGNGSGKVTITHNGSSKTLNATSSEGNEIPTGSMVKVDSYDGSTVSVSLINK